MSQSTFKTKESSMSEDTTTTDAPVVEGGDAPVDSATSQPETTESAPAEVSAEAPNTEPTNEQSDDMSSWAQSKGFDLNNPEDVAKMAKSYRESEKKMHQSSQQASELKNVIKEEAASAGIPDNDVLAMKQEFELMKANQAVNDFYAENPDARQYDAEMAAIVRENPNVANAGIEALYALAKVRALENGGEEQLKQEGGKTALQNLAQRQKAAAPSPSATTAASAPSGITLQDVQNALSRGDKQWIFDHQTEIDAL